MEEFNYPVQSGVSESVKANIHKVDFGDGYQQRAKKGINNRLREFNVKFVGTYFEKNGKIVTDLAVTAVLDFLNAHEGYKAFNWTSYLYPNNKPIKVYCQQWNTTYNNGRYEISMKFEETL